MALKELLKKDERHTVLVNDSQVPAMKEESRKEKGKREPVNGHSLGSAITCLSTGRSTHLRAINQSSIMSCTKNLP